MNEYNISVYQGYDSDKELDKIINTEKSDYFSLSPSRLKNDGYLSEGDLMLKNLDEFIALIESSKIKASAFIYGVFDKIEESINITPFLERLKNTSRNVYIFVCKSYPTEKFEGFAKIFKI